MRVGGTIRYPTRKHTALVRRATLVNPPDELIDDAAHSVYRYGEAKARGCERVAGGGGVNADQAAAAVQQRATRVSCRNPGLGGRGGARDDGRG